jgi:hypothetical protein
MKLSSEQFAAVAEYGDSEEIYKLFLIELAKRFAKKQYDEELLLSFEDALDIPNDSKEAIRDIIGKQASK